MDLHCPCPIGVTNIRRRRLRNTRFPAARYHLTGAGLSPAGTRQLRLTHRNWKFESISLQRRVYKLSVPGHVGPADYRTRHAGYGVKAVAWARRWTADQFVITTSLARRPQPIRRRQLTERGNVEISERDLDWSNKRSLPAAKVGPRYTTATTPPSPHVAQKLLQ